MNNDRPLKDIVNDLLAAAPKRETKGQKKMAEVRGKIKHKRQEAKKQEPKAPLWLPQALVLRHTRTTCKCGQVFLDPGRVFLRQIKVEGPGAQSQHVKDSAFPTDSIREMYRDALPQLIVTQEEQCDECPSCFHTGPPQHQRQLSEILEEAQHAHTSAAN